MNTRCAKQLPRIAAIFLSAFVSGEAVAGTADTGTSDKAVVDDGGNFTKSRFKISADLREGYDDNVNTTHTDQISSFFTSLYASIFADLGNARTVFTIGIGGGATYYYDRPGNKVDWLGSLTLNILHKVDDRLTLGLKSYNTYQVQPNYDLQVLQNRNNGQYFYTSNEFSAAYQWTRRFQTVTSFTLYGVFYQDSIQKQQENELTYLFGNQFRFLLSPKTVLVGEYRLGYTDYMHLDQRNSLSNYFLVGFDHSFSPKFSVTLRAGAQVEAPDVGATKVSPYVEATTSYAYQKYSNLQWYLHYGLDNSGFGLNLERPTLRTGFRINQGITPKLSYYLGVFFENVNSGQTIVAAANRVTENTIDISTGFRFVVTPKLTLEAGYVFTEVLSNASTLEYTRNQVSIGANYTF